MTDGSAQAASARSHHSTAPLLLIAYCSPRHCPAPPRQTALAWTMTNKLAELTVPATLGIKYLQFELPPSPRPNLTFSLWCGCHSLLLS